MTAISSKTRIRAWNSPSVSCLVFTNVKMRIYIYKLDEGNFIERNTMKDKVMAAKNFG